MSKWFVVCLLGVVGAVSVFSSAAAQPRPPFPLPPKPPFGEKPPLGKKPPSPAELFRKVIQDLNSGDESSRLDAAERLRGFGSLGAEKATAALVKALDDKSEHVRYAAL